LTSVIWLAADSPVSTSWDSWHWVATAVLPLLAGKLEVSADVFRSAADVSVATSWEVRPSVDGLTSAALNASVAVSSTSVEWLAADLVVWTARLVHDGSSASLTRFASVAVAATVVTVGTALVSVWTSR